MNHHHHFFCNPHNASLPRKVLMFLSGIVIGVLFALLFGLLVLAVWNWVIPAVFGGPQLNYWQAVGLLILAKLLLGGFHHGDHHPRSHHNLPANHPYPGCTDQQAGQWENYTRFWNEEGKAAFDAYTERLNKEQ